MLGASPLFVRPRSTGARTVASFSSARRAIAAAAAVAVLALAGCTATPSAAPAATPAPTATVDAAAIGRAVEQVIADRHLGAVLVQVTRGDQVLVSQAWGESYRGVPATVDMHFRNGALSIPQIATVLLQLVDEGAVSLDDPIARWLPDVPHAAEVTLGQLAQMTAGYADFVHSDAFVAAFKADPFRQWTPEELAAYGTGQPLAYTPGTNWNYSHTDYVLLGLALERITGRTLDDLITQRVLLPLGMTQTKDAATAALQHPALHAVDGERRAQLQIPAGVPFTEDSTYWNPSWTMARGAVQNSTVADMATMMRAVGRGDLLSAASHALMIAPTLRGTTSTLPGCATCAPMSDRFTYGYGIVLSGDWMLQNPLFGGYAGLAAYSPKDDVTISVATTFAEGAFALGADSDTNPATTVYARIAAIVAPDASTPMS